MKRLYALCLVTLGVVLLDIILLHDQFVPSNHRKSELMPFRGTSELLWLQ
jgi:hypothetical protein